MIELLKHIISVIAIPTNREKQSLTTSVIASEEKQSHERNSNSTDYFVAALLVMTNPFIL